MAKKKICIDAGHYGKYNRSPANKAYYESEMVWKLHLLLKKYLELYGFEVILTRADQKKDMGLKARGRKAKGCDLLLSIHSNAAKKLDESIDYPVVYYPISGVCADLAKKLSECIESVMGTKQKGKAESRKGSGNWDYYSVIYGAVSVGVPALILEHSFHTNTRATNWLLDEKNLDKMAQAEAAIIAEHYGMKKVTESPKTEKADALDIDGVWGQKTTTRLQQIFGTTVDGVISNQWEQYKYLNPGLSGGWQWREKPNGNGSQLIKAMQKWAGMASADRDGEIGDNTIKAFQKKLGTTVDGRVSYPSQMVKALQKWANNQ